MIIDEIKSAIRHHILKLANLHIPSQSADQQPSILEEHRFAAIDLACSALQGSSDLDFDLALSQYEQDMQAQRTAMSEENKILYVAETLKREMQELFRLSRNLAQLQSETDGDPQNMEAPSLQDLSETVYVAHGQLEAESIRLFLGSFGIPALVAQESAGVALGLTVGMLGEADVRIAPSDVDDAIALLEAMDAGLFVYPEELGDEGGDLFDEYGDEDAQEEDEER